MGARNVWRLLQEALIGAENADLASGDSLQVIPATNDQGSIIIGSATKDIDVKVFLGGDGSYVLLDSGGKVTTLSGISLTVDSAVTLSGATSLTGTMTKSASGFIARKVITEATAARTISALDYGAIVKLTGAAGATTVTLPAPAAGNAGAVIMVVSESDHAHVVSLVNKIVAPNTVTSDSLTAADVSKIGQSVTLISDGSKWVLTAWTGTWTVAA